MVPIPANPGAVIPQKTAFWKKATVVFIIVGVLLAIAYDVFIFEGVGWLATISAVTGGWLSIPYFGTLLATAIGGLGGHLLGMTLRKIGLRVYTRIIGFTVGVIAMYIYTYYFT